MRWNCSDDCLLAITLVISSTKSKNSYIGYLSDYIAIHILRTLYASNLLSSVLMFYKLWARSPPVYVQCMSSWGTPALTKQTKTADTKAERISIIATLFCRGGHWHLTEVVSPHVTRKWGREVLKPQLKTPRSLPNSAKVTGKELYATIWLPYLKCVPNLGLGWISISVWCWWGNCMAILLRVSAIVLDNINHAFSLCNWHLRLGFLKI